MEQTAPVTTEERLRSVDMLRGIALLGILLMNIQNFGLPSNAYENPAAWGGATGANLAYWVMNQIFFEGKMRFLFSMLFGAGVILLTERAERRGAGITTADIYLRRNLWLVVIGMLHGYLIWEGDILYPYGMTGLGLFVFRNLSVKKLLLTAGVVFVLLNLSMVGYIYSQYQTRTDGIAAQKIEEAKRTKKQKKAAEQYQELLDNEDPVKRKKIIEEEIADRRKGYGDNIGWRAPHVFSMQTTMMIKFLLWDVAFPMLLGMALFKAGVLTAERSTMFYLKLAGCGYLLGVPPVAYMTKLVMDAGWDVWTRPWLMATYEYGRLTIGLAHMAVWMLVFKLGWLKPLTWLLSQVGQMALTNYLLTSVLVSLYFNGYGLGKFGALERHQLLYVVLGMWSINLILSPLWLKYFRFGPAEWAWRSLTYWKKQPLRLSPAPTGEPLPGLPSEP